MAVPLPLTYYIPKTDCTVSEPREQRYELGERDQAGQLPLPRTISATSLIPGEPQTTGARSKADLRQITGAYHKYMTVYACS